MGTTARRAFVVTLVAVATIAAALALWALKLLIALLLYGLAIAAAMRPGVEWLAARRIPRPIGIAVHYIGLLGVVGVLIWLAVPAAIHQVEAATGAGVPTSATQLHQAAAHSTGLKHDIFASLERWLRHAPKGSQLVRPALNVTKTALEVLVGIFFVLATAAYWIFERDRTIGLVTSLLARG